MKKLESKNNMTVVHLASGNSKPVAPRVDKSIDRKSDPSSSLRSDRYPIPLSFDYLANKGARELYRIF